jgi:glutathione synthase/RimK-type ligase-like ATP-grasp enzyme
MNKEKINVLVINGIGSKGYVDVIHANSFGKISYKTYGSCNIFSYLPSELINITHFIIDHLEQQEISLKYILKHDIVFCEISDPDSHSVALAKTRNLYNALEGKIPWINNPHHVARTGRDTISRLLTGIENVVAPKAVKIKSETVECIKSAVTSNDFTFPVLIRPTGSHGGENLAMIMTIEDLENIDLSVYRELFVTEYVNYESDNIFSKYRFAVIEGEPFIRHVIFSDHWIIHSESRNFMANNPQFQKQEAAIIECFESDLKVQIEEAIHAIYRAIGLDYFGIDCSIQNNELILFEVNANMNMLDNNQVKPNIWEHQIDRIVQGLVNKLIISRVKK